MEGGRERAMNGGLAGERKKAMDRHDDEKETLNQIQELLVTGEAESDLDVACRLQLEEVMAASLSLQPSSSSEPAASNVDQAVAEDDDALTEKMMILQALEFDRYHQELRDTEQSQAEMRRITAGLHRTAHDQAFAREMSMIPQEEWEDWGDEFERPFEAVGSGVKVEPAAEPFRLYFKGMTSDELVKGEHVQLSAIGVAVCDCNDNLVLKIQKPVMQAGFSREVLEAKALVEGLNAVISLGIKRVYVLCDYKALYNHIVGKWRVRQQKVAMVINLVQLLQKRLEICKFYLVPRCHVRFVFPLARDVIDSQVSKEVGLKGNASLKETCKICLEDTDSSEMFDGDGCVHKFCFSCMRQHVEVKLLHGMLPHCPQEGCNVRLTAEGSRKFLLPRILGILVQRLKEASIPPDERIYCPYPKCSALMSRTEPLTVEGNNRPRQGIVYPSGLRRCIQCDGSFCINCKVPWHDRLSCHEYKFLNPHPHAEDAKLYTLAKDKMWRQCIRCKNLVELAEGCFHITCRCGYEFCYTCGAEWKNKRATCSCPLWDEGYIWHDDDLEDYDEDDFDHDTDSDDYYDDDYGI